MRYTLGRTIFTTLIAAGIFGLILLVSPRLSYSEGSATTTPPTTLSTAPMVSTTTTVPRTTTTAPAPVTTTTVPVVVTTTTLGIEEWNPAEMTPENGYDGSIELTAVEPEPQDPADLDTVTWHIEATNTTDDRLWGVFAYVEGFGRASCDEHVLRAGETAVCRVQGPVYAGTHSVVVWVDAWTLASQVSDKVLVELAVSS